MSKLLRQVSLHQIVFIFGILHLLPRIIQVHPLWTCAECETHFLLSINSNDFLLNFAYVTDLSKSSFSQNLLTSDGVCYLTIIPDIFSRPASRNGRCILRRIGHASRVERSLSAGFRVELSGEYGRITVRCDWDTVGLFTKVGERGRVELPGDYGRRITVEGVDTVVTRYKVWWGMR